MQVYSTCQCDEVLVQNKGCSVDLGSDVSFLFYFFVFVSELIALGNKLSLM